MIAGSLQLAIAFEQCSVQFVGAFNTRAQHRRAQAVNLAPARIQNQQSLRGKNLRVEIGKCLGQGAARLVSSGQCLHCIGRAEQFACAIDERDNPLVQHLAAYGPPDRGLFHLRILQFFQRPSGRKRDVVDLVEVVVFSSQPEDGGVRMASGGCLACASDGGRGLERRKQRPAKEPDLLPGHDCPSTIGERRKRGRGRSSDGVLRGQQPHDLRPVRWNRRPARRPSIQWQKGAERPGTVVQKQPAHSRHHGHRITVCGGQLGHFRRFILQVASGAAVARLRAEALHGCGRLDRLN